MRQGRKVQLRQRHIGDEWTGGGRLALHEVDRPVREFAVDEAPLFEIVDREVPGRRAFDALHHVGHRHDGGIEPRRRREHGFVRRARNAVPFVEAAVLGQPPLAVAQVPLAEAGGGVAGALQQFAQRDLPGDEPLRQAGRHRLHRPGADRMATGHQRRARRHAIALDVEVEAGQSLRRQGVDPRRRRTAQDTAAVAAEFAPPEVVGQDQNDVGLAHGHGSLLQGNRRRVTPTQACIKCK